MISRHVGKRRVLGWRLLAALVLAAGAGLGGAADASDSHPDLTGIWTLYVEAGKSAFIAPMCFIEVVPVDIDGDDALDFSERVESVSAGTSDHCDTGGLLASYQMFELVRQHLCLADVRKGHMPFVIG